MRFTSAMWNSSDCPTLLQPRMRMPLKPAYNAAFNDIHTAHCYHWG